MESEARARFGATNSGTHALVATLARCFVGAGKFAHIRLDGFLALFTADDFALIVDALAEIRLRRLHGTHIG